MTSSGEVACCSWTPLTSPSPSKHEREPVVTFSCPKNSKGVHTDYLPTGNQSLLEHELQMEPRRLPAPKSCPSPDSTYSHAESVYRDYMGLILWPSSKGSKLAWMGHKNNKRKMCIWGSKRENCDTVTQPNDWSPHMYTHTHTRTRYWESEWNLKLLLNVAFASVWRSRWKHLLLNSPFVSGPLLPSSLPAAEDISPTTVKLLTRSKFDRRT